jgi:site-specific DNA-methyltransferase (adenine-specific)
MNKLIHGDCLEAMKTIESGSIDAIITDPPYGTTACKWDSIIDFGLMWEQLNRIIKPNGAVVLFGSEPFSSALRMSNIKDYKYDWIWNKVTGSGHLNSKIKPMQQTENIMIFNAKGVYRPIKERISDYELKKKLQKISKLKSYTNNTQEITGKRKELSYKDRNLNDYKTNYPSNIITISKYSKECNNTKRIHPTQKPIELMEYLIKTYTNEGETVLDFTMGSGTTGVAAINLKRNFIGIEKDKKYFDIATKRINEETIQIKLF